MSGVWAVLITVVLTACAGSRPIRPADIEVG